MPILDALASRAAPIAKKTAPMATARVRPKLSDKAPEKSDVKVAGNSIDETTKPCKEDERTPKEFVKEGMVVTGPMVPVSRLSTFVTNQSAMMKTMRNMNVPIEKTAQ
ncbi:MAG: hypothetical protein M1830_003005 [Pleopsidium flavum]|nr:MAG: hypothetical protein M1830_003005 [Pleopsidium flavum]